MKSKHSIQEIKSGKLLNMLVNGQEIEILILVNEDSISMSVKDSDYIRPEILSDKSMIFKVN